MPAAVSQPAVITVSDDLFTVSETARRAGYTPRWIRCLIQQGRITAFLLSGDSRNYLVSWKSVVRHLDAKGTNSSPPLNNNT